MLENTPMEMAGALGIVCGAPVLLFLFWLLLRSWAAQDDTDIERGEYARPAGHGCSAFLLGGVLLVFLLLSGMAAGLDH